MARLTVFCLEPELNRWLCLLSTHYHLAALVFRRDHQGGIIRPVGTEDVVEQQVYRLFMLPRDQEPVQGMSMNDVASRDRRYLDDEPGGLVDVDGERCLIYSQIVGEDFAHEPVHPARSVHWLRRRVKKEAQAGAIGWNEVSGGSSFYRDLWHTEAAQALAAEGVIWKPSLQSRACLKPSGPGANA